MFYKVDRQEIDLFSNSSLNPISGNDKITGSGLKEFIDESVIQND
jgi:hypothetical protein